MKNLKKFLLLLGMIVFLTTAVGCEEQGPMEKAGEKIDETIEKAGENIEEGGEEIQQAAEDAQEQIEEAGDNLQK